jgi:hypothetical protein
MINEADSTLWGRFKKTVPVKKFLSQGQGTTSPGTRRVVRRRDPREAYSPSEDGPRITFWARLARKFMLGLSLVGILSFLK